MNLRRRCPLAEVTIITIFLILSQSAFYESIFLVIKLFRSSLSNQKLNQYQPSSLRKSLNNKIINRCKQAFKNTLILKINQYEKSYNKYLQTLRTLPIEQQKWKPDPELTTNFDLTSAQPNHTFILKGQQTSRLILDITISNVDELNTKNEGVIVILINLSALNQDLKALKYQPQSQTYQQTIIKNTDYKTHIRNHHFAVIPFTSDIYEILIIRQNPSKQGFIDAHVSLQVDIEQQVGGQRKSQKVSISLQEENQMVQNMKKIVEQNEITFLESLQLWEKVQKHRKQHEQSFEWNESVQLMQCLGLVVLYVIQYGILRFITRKKEVI